jgi:hypothetical protein
LSLIWLTPKVAIFVAIRKEAQKKEKAWSRSHRSTRWPA